MKLLNEILGTKYPIIQGGMANIATGEFAAACSNAGALGLIGAGGMNAETLRENIRRCKALTDKPFGVNIMLMHPQADEFAKIVVEEGVKVVTTGAGNPGKYVPMWKEAGIKVIPVVAAAVLAKHLAPLGVDAVIAEGTESGGHVGEMTTMALVPQVVDAVDVPVIAAGGIADGRQLAAAFALGACGVQVGTCLLVSEECPVHENYKAALLRAKDSDTIVTGRIGGTPVRVLKNRMSREYVRQEKAGADKMELEKYTLGSLRRAVFEGDTATGSLMAGQVAGMLHEVRPVADILDELWRARQWMIRASYMTAASRWPCLSYRAAWAWASPSAGWPVRSRPAAAWGASHRRPLREPELAQSLAQNSGAERDRQSERDRRRRGTGGYQRDGRHPELRRRRPHGCGGRRGCHRLGRAGLPLELPGLVEKADVALAPIVSSGRAAKLILRRWAKPATAPHGSRRGLRVGHPAFRKKSFWPENARPSTRSCPKCWPR